MTVDALIEVLQQRKVWGESAGVDVGKLHVRFHGGQGHIYHVGVEGSEVVVYTARGG